MQYILRELEKISRNLAKVIDRIRYKNYENNDDGIDEISIEKLAQANEMIKNEISTIAEHPFYIEENNE